MKKRMNLKTLYMSNRVSSSIVTTDRRNFEIIEERKAHYSIRKRQIGIRQKFFNRSVYAFFFYWEGHLLAFPLQVLPIVANLGFMVPGVRWPIMMRLVGMRPFIAILRVVRLTMIFAMGWWFLDLFVA
jgi:hypothetical protein